MLFLPVMLVSQPVTHRAHKGILPEGRSKIHFLKYRPQFPYSLQNMATRGCRRAARLPAGAIQNSDQLGHRLSTSSVVTLDNKRARLY